MRALLAEMADHLTDEEVYRDLNPVLVAHLQERVEADPSLRRPLAVAALGRIFGWQDEAS